MLAKERRNGSRNRREITETETRFKDEMFLQVRLDTAVSGIHWYLTTSYFNNLITRFIKHTHEIDAE